MLPLIIFVASFPGSPLAPTKNKNYFSSGRGESLGTRLSSLYNTGVTGGAPCVYGESDGIQTFLVGIRHCC